MLLRIKHVYYSCFVGFRPKDVNMEVQCLLSYLQRKMDLADTGSYPS